MSVAGYVWLGLVVVTIIIEFLTLELVSIWVSLGSLVGLILELCGVPLEWQIVVAVVVTIVCILGLRRFCVKFLLKSKEKTNMDIYIGAKEKLVTKIDGDGLGSIRINGVTWSAKSENGESIKEGSLVEILRLEGNRFVVRRARIDKKVRAENGEASSVKATEKIKVSPISVDAGKQKKVKKGTEDANTGVSKEEPKADD